MDALALFAELGKVENAEYRRVPMQTACRGAVDKIIRERGVPQARLVLKTITESCEQERAMAA